VQAPHHSHEPKDSQAPIEGFVNVLFHGLYLFIVREQQIDVLIPNLREHVYRAGPFLGEQTLPPAGSQDPYRLEGVEGSRGNFDSSINNVLRGFDYEPNLPAARLYARIVVPRPLEPILSFRDMEEPYDTSIDELQLFRGKKTRALHVLRYRAADLKEVQLHPHHAKIGHHQIGDVAFKNIHIQAEPDHAGDPSHPVKGFEETVDLMPEVRGRARLRRPTKCKGTTLAGTEYGFSHHETLDLVSRHKLLIQVGMLWRIGESAGPDLSDLVGDPPFECSPIISDVS
jgi:hypothetical protein